MHRFLAFDFGAESGRANLASLTADRITLDEVHRFPSRNGQVMGTLQWDLVSLWEDIKTGLRLASLRTDGAGGISGIGVDTWGVDFALLGADGVPMGNPVHYRDARTDGIMEKLFAEVSREEVFGVTGLQFMPLNTLFQLFAHSRSPGGKAQLAAARHLLFMPDLFHYLLSGKINNELTIASTSQMLDARSRQWATPLLERLGLPAHLLGEIVQPGTQLGGLLPAVARETGAAAGLPIIAPASHDTASAVAAVPITADSEAGGWAYLSSGTWSLLGVESAEPVIDARTLGLNYTNEQGAAGKVRLLKNIMGLWLVQETRRDLARRGADFDYAQLTELAAAAPPLRTLLDTWHPPFATPGDFLSKIENYARSTGQEVPSVPGAFVRACLDSLALSYRAVLDNLEVLTGKPIHTLHIVGGGTQNLLLNQLTADATRRRVVAGPVEATALGNVMTQALSAGAVPNLKRAREIIAASFDVRTYEPLHSSGFDAAYPMFKQLTGL